MGKNRRVKWFSDWQISDGDDSLYSQRWDNVVCRYQGISDLLLEWPGFYPAEGFAVNDHWKLLPVLRRHVVWGERDPAVRDQGKTPNVCALSRLAHEKISSRGKQASSVEGLQIKLQWWDSQVDCVWYCWLLPRSRKQTLLFPVLICANHYVQAVTLTCVLTYCTLAQFVRLVLHIHPLSFTLYLSSVVGVCWVNFPVHHRKIICISWHFQHNQTNSFFVALMHPKKKKASASQMLIRL